MIKRFVTWQQKIGLRGEQIAQNYLCSKGYVIRETNFSSKYGEIDIVAVSREAFHFIEVKTSVSHETTTKFSSKDFPLRNVTREKLERMERTAASYLEESVSRVTDYTFDALLVVIRETDSKAFVRHLVDIV